MSQTPFCHHLYVIVRSLFLGLGALIAISPSFLLAAPSSPPLVTQLVYSTNPQYPPYHWVVDEEHFDGASIELLRLVMPEGIAVRPVVFPWKRTLLLVSEGEVDLVLSLRITPERLQYLEFCHHRAFPNPIVVFVRKDHAFAFTSREDLKGLRGGVSLGDTFGGGFDEYWQKELSVEVAPTMVENFRKLQAGRIDYFVSGYYLGMAYIARNNLAGELTALTPPLSNFDIFFGFSKRSKARALIPEIDRRLEQLDGDGALVRLLEKYLDTYPHATLPHEPR